MRAVLSTVGASALPSVGARVLALVGETTREKDLSRSSVSKCAMRPARRLLIAVLCTFWVASAQAQRAPTPDDLRGRLHSDVPAEIAWAAFDAGTYQISEVVPDLNVVLASPPAASPLEHDFLAAAVLDALIHVHRALTFQIRDATVPSTILERYYDRWPVQTLILLERNGPSADDVLLRLLPRATDETWFTIANLLLPRAPLGLAADVLRGLKLELQITVTDRGRSGGIGNEKYGFSHGDGIGEQPLGFPPHAIYGFVLAPYPGAVVLSRGPHISYYYRQVAPMRQFPISSSSNGGRTAEDQLAYLEEILRRTGSGSALRARTSVEVPWENASKLLARVAMERKKIGDVYKRTLGQLIRSGRMTADEARALPLTLNVTVNDSRSDRRQPLPELVSPAR